MWPHQRPESEELEMSQNLPPVTPIRASTHWYVQCAINDDTYGYLRCDGVVTDDFDDVEIYSTKKAAQEAAKSLDGFESIEVISNVRY